MFNTWSADKRATFIDSFGVFNDLGLPVASEEELDKYTNHISVSVMDGPVSISTTSSCYSRDSHVSNSIRGHPKNIAPCHPRRGIKIWCGSMSARTVVSPLFTAHDHTPTDLVLSIEEPERRQTSKLHKFIKFGRS